MLTRELLRADWMNKVSRLSIDEADGRFSEQMMSVATLCMPVNEITVRQHDTPVDNPRYKETDTKE